jgi:hypothetical protein
MAKEDWKKYREKDFKTKKSYTMFVKYVDEDYHYWIAIIKHGNKWAVEGNHHGLPSTGEKRFKTESEARKFARDFIDKN